MKPRQTIKNYHNSNAPPYQNNQTSSTSSFQSLRDIDLVKLGLDLDDMPNLQAANTTHKHPTNQDEIVKCLQAIYGKSSTDILQKLPTLEEWPMQSVSPPDYSRIPNNTANNSVTGIHGGAGSGGDATSFNTINNTTSNNIKQDLQFANSQTSSAINQQFRVSSSNIHSPQQQQLPLQQQKSVLSLHQHHQNDFSNRRLNHHHHHHQHLSTTSASFANLNTVSATNTTSTAAPSTLDTNNLNTLSGDIISSKNSSVVVGPHVSNIMDPLGSMDDLFYDNSIMTSKESSTLSNQQSLMKHQQLQKLLKVTGSQLISASSTPSSTTMQSSHRNESQTQRNLLANSMSQSQHQLSSPASAISPPQPTAFSSVPKSLLNLAACSSSTPTSTNTSSLPTASKYSSMVSQLNLMSSRHSGNNISGKSFPRTANNIINSSNIISNHNTSNELSSQKGTNGNDLSNSGFQQITNRYTTTSSSQTVGTTTKSNSKQPIQVSLLSEDQLGNNRNNSKTLCNVNPGTSSRLFSQNQGQNFPNPSTSREAFLANLQERAARAGVSIGEINKPSQAASTSSANTSLSTNNSTNTLTVNQKNTVNISPNPTKDDFIGTVDRKEIESALSRVGARNDLSLLYPPLLLASNSQKQINALSAGLQGTDDSELFTKEVKKIVLEECNIIYECKECNNLFRSLANLVKHKRTYCTEKYSGRNNVDLNKRQYTNTSSPEDQRPTITPNAATFSLCDFQEPELDNELDSNIVFGNRSENSTPVISCNTEGRNNNLSSMIRLIQNQESKNQELEFTPKLARLQKNQNNKVTNVTNLSKLLRSQPKNRLPVSRDSALLDALNITSSSTIDTNRLFTFESDKNINCNEVNEQLVRNSSLAKTLLNEKVRVSNPRQSLIELSKAETSLQRATNAAPKRAAPKRKFLEDCIKKVKRDKLFTEDDDEEECVQSHLSVDRSSIVVKPSSIQQIAETDSEHVQEITPKSESSKLDNMGDSDVESNVLMIDLESPKKKTLVKKTKKKAGSTPTSSLSSNKLSSSSALLKALTRPVDKRPYKNTTSTNEESSQQPLLESNEESLHQQTTLELEGESTYHQQPSLESEEEKSKEKEVKLETEEDRLELEEPIQLFDKQTCDICEQDHDDLESLLSHIIKKHSDQKMVYPCIFCSLSFITLENVCRHILDIHQKPKAQVHRLKEVVRSRSYISTDFLACSDYPSMSIVDEEEVSSVSTAASEDSELLSEEETSFKSKDITEESSQVHSESKVQNSGKHISATESQSGPVLSTEDNESSSENYAESEGVDYDSTPPHDSDKEETSPEVAKQDNQQKPPSIRSTLETTPSASGTGGGIMKLKIQLKTRPDEKSKVYEIV